jgi:glycosyltransferase involved in cell wall biosynthesis
MVTVIIPSYNSADIVENAIRSVLAQTYSDYELIVVDDGSTDNTVEHVMKYKDKLRYIHQENGGVSKARNTGIKQSNGSYVAFLDADDVWENNKLEIQMACFKRHTEVDFIFSGFRLKKNKDILKNIKYEDTFNIFKEYWLNMKNIFDFHSSIIHEDIKIEFYWGDIYKYLFLGNFILPSSVIFKKDSLSTSGLLNETYRVAEETEFFLRYSRYNKIGFVDVPLLFYEVPDSENLSGKKNTERLIRNALKIQIDSILENQGVYEKNRGYFDRGLSMTYCRLAYYYLSEYRMSISRKYAVHALKLHKWNIKSYWIFILGFTPKHTLENLAKFKQWGKRLI